MEDIVIVQERLSDLAFTHNIKTLYACESGSRAWGFPSPNSDYDVRFIYAQDLDWHLSLVDKKDTIDLPISNDLDIGGWEIRKTLGLLWKSNAPLLEWLQSPIVYQVDDQFVLQMRELSQEYFSPIAVMHHYLSMSKKYFEACQHSEAVKLKKYFYALRTAIAGSWVREKKTIPPIELPKMFEIISDNVRDKVQELIVLKAQQNEDYLHGREALLDEFLSETIKQNEAIASKLPSANGDIEKLDDFYRNILKKVSPAGGG
ncbi:nucleotidyltransferase domain-containing protein [Marivirga lumbricoides]|uniref:Nucleotidyltransferase domain-containing protein n=1 Tax=Marivirga lumbricoides TaxID=1046115 RepID=A0A2T4DQ50_9BACT|nr:nucleotidyltransferase domain-containing protein [Marivirga lumbricoides]